MALSKKDLFMHDLFIRYRRYILQVIRYDVRDYDRHMANDLLNDVMIEAIRHYKKIRFMDENVLKKWLRVVIHHKVINHYNSARIKRNIPLSEISEPSFGQDPPFDPAMLDLKTVLMDLRNKDEVQYDILLLRYYFNYKLKDIALLLKISVPLVKKKLSAAKEFVKKEYGNYGK